jgi:hypothetical protein
LLAPLGSKLGIDVKNDLVMIIEHAVCEAVDGEDIRELLDAIDDPLASMFIAVAGMSINAAKKSTTDTT